jgi:hypothetical protein
MQSYAVNRTLAHVSALVKLQFESLIAGRLPKRSWQS